MHDIGTVAEEKRTHPEPWINHVRGMKEFSKDGFEDCWRWVTCDGNIRCKHGGLAAQHSPTVTLELVWNGHTFDWKVPVKYQTLGSEWLR